MKKSTLCGILLTLAALTPTKTANGFLNSDGELMSAVRTDVIRPLMYANVETGEGLSQVAKRVCGRSYIWPEIARINHVSEPDYIVHPGDKLVLPYSCLVKDYIK